MTMIVELKQKVLEASEAAAVSRKRPADRYSAMKYPKWPALMRFAVDQYDLEGFGHLMSMHTTTKMGMELITFSFMPKEGLTVPYFLLDAMSMKKKRCVFAEFYGCGYEPLSEEALFSVHEKYASLPEYAEKENWYIRERRPYSLIKTGEEGDLIKMAEDMTRAYLAGISGAGKDPAYAKKLLAFRERMITEGNPSSKTLTMLLGADGAVQFMKDVVMPV